MVSTGRVSVVASLDFSVHRERIRVHTFLSARFSTGRALIVITISLYMCVHVELGGGGGNERTESVAPRY